MPVRISRHASSCARSEGGGSTSDRLCSIRYTSGTTGTPKGVCMSRTFLEKRLPLWRDFFGHSSQDVVSLVVPVTTATGILGTPDPT